MAALAAGRVRRGRTLAMGSAALATAAITLALLWRVLPAAAPPLYDGVCIADPYRLAGQSPAPSSASSTYPGAQFPTSEVQTTETPPQAQVLMMAGTFTSQATVTVSVTPAAAPAPPPPGMLQDGNAYRITAVSGGQSLEPAAQASVTVVLRGTGAASPLTMYVDSGSGWRQLRTFNLGCGFTFEAVSSNLGYFALFRPASSGSSGSTGPGGGGFPVAVVVGVLGALVIIATIGLARFSAGRRR